MTIDEDGWIRIHGRVKRFAKIAGEMVSLTAAENLAAGVWPDARHAVIAMPDARKGEKLVLVTDRLDAQMTTLLAHAREVGAPELLVPSRIVRAPEVPGAWYGQDGLRRHPAHRRERSQGSLKSGLHREQIGPRVRRVLLEGA